MENNQHTDSGVSRPDISRSALFACSRRRRRFSATSVDQQQSRDQARNIIHRFVPYINNNHSRAMGSCMKDPWFQVKVSVDPDVDVYQLCKKLMDRGDDLLSSLQFYKCADYVVFVVLENDGAKRLARLCNHLKLKPASSSNYEEIVPCRVLSFTPFLASKIESLHEVLLERYNKQQEHFDASDLLNDMRIRWIRAFLRIQIYYYMQLLVDFIRLHCPNIVSLDMSRNTLISFDGLKHLVKIAPRITKLNIERNNIKGYSVRAYDSISGWNLEELRTDNWSGNNLLLPVVDDDSNERFRCLKCHFPNLKKLNDVTVTLLTERKLQLPPQVGEVNQSSLISASAFDVVKTFVQNYMTLYKNSNPGYDDVGGLMTSYDSDDCIFTLSCPIVNPRMHPYSFLAQNYVSNKMGGSASRTYIGWSDISRVLAYLPKFEYVEESLDLEIQLNTPELVSFVLRGRYCHAPDAARRKGESLKSFTRLFVCRVDGTNSKLLIINDQLFVRNATKQEKSKISVGQESSLTESLSQLNIESSSTESSTVITRSPTPHPHSYPIIS